MTRVLIAGGYGVVGSWIARELKAAHPALELMIGGRSPENGAALAAELGATTARLDVSDPAAGLSQAGPLDLVIASLQDPADKLALAALKHGAAYTTIVRPPQTMSALVIAAELTQRAALVLGHWQAGAMSLAALSATRAFGAVERVEFGALYDQADPAGPMATADSGTFFENGALIRRAGEWVRVNPTADARTVSRGGGAPHFNARPMTVLDCPGLTAATSAAEVRFDLGVGRSLGTLAGSGASHEIYIDLWGRGAAGETKASRTVLSDPRGQAHLTASGVLIGVERLLGLDGKPPLRPGVAFPEAVIDAEAAVHRLLELGVNIQTVSSDPVASD
jgi:hypothetical protein